MNENLAYQEESWREELIAGKWIAMAPPAINHNRIVVNISQIFAPYLKGKDCEYFSDGASLFLTDNDYYIPDGMIVCDPNKVKVDGIHGAPDLVIEVLSPSTARYDRGRKKDAYERCGVREYWIVDPANKTIEQRFLQNEKFVLHETYSILPGWMLARMKPDEKAAISTEFKCSLYDDLVISLEDIFDRVP